MFIMITIPVSLKVDTIPINNGLSIEDAEIINKFNNWSKDHEDCSLILHINKCLEIHYPCTAENQLTKENFELFLINANTKKNGYTVFYPKGNPYSVDLAVVLKRLENSVDVINLMDRAVYYDPLSGESLQPARYLNINDFLYDQYYPYKDTVEELLDRNNKFFNNYTIATTIMQSLA